MKIKKLLGAFLCLVLIISGCQKNKNTSDNIEVTENTVNDEYIATCLELKPDDTTVFGRAIAVSDDYVAIGDSEANRVVIYTRNQNNNAWQRIKEIYPPSGTYADRLGNGFGSELIINDDILVIQNYKYGWSTARVTEAYTVSLNTENSNFIVKQVKYPDYRENRLVSVAFLGKNIVIGTEKHIDSKRKISSYVVDSVSNEIVGEIKLPELHPSYTYTLHSYKDSLIFHTVSHLWQNSLIQIYPDGRHKNIIFNPEILNIHDLPPKFSSFGLDLFSISDEVTAMGRANSRKSETIVFRGFPEIAQFETFPIGKLDVRQSHVLISHPPFLNVKSSDEADVEKRRNHTFVQASESQILLKSQIRWERRSKNYEFKTSNSRFAQTAGSIGTEELFLSAAGRVVYLPIKNIPEKYEIKLSICGE